MWWQRHLSEFVTLFLVINPFEVLPAFMAMVAGMQAAAQRRLALRAVLVAFAVLLGFILGGKFLLERMHIPIRAFQISGGLVLFLLALEMVRGETHHVEPNDPQESLKSLAVYPLAIPKIAGPGAMLAVILLTDDDRFNILGQLATVGVLALVLAIVFVILLAAGPILRVIGTTGANIIGRVTGLMLAALAVSMVLGAVGEWLNLPKL